MLRRSVKAKPSAYIEGEGIGKLGGRNCLTLMP